MATKKAASKSAGKRGRSAKSGEFVGQPAVEKNPDTTVNETAKPKKRGSSKKRPQVIRRTCMVQAVVPCGMSFSDLAVFDKTGECEPDVCERLLFQAANEPFVDLRRRKPQPVHA